MAVAIMKMARIIMRMKMRMVLPRMFAMLINVAAGPNDHSYDQQWNSGVQHLVIIRVSMMPIQAIISWDNIVIETNQKSGGGKLRGNNITIS